jgi:hypothetical protein
MAARTATIPMMIKRRLSCFSAMKYFSMSALLNINYG